ncbi:MAG: ubiquinone biosynthesis protein UbiH [Zetaproteobacteria bacterium]|nr:MAG: ubiquinone biosynthesis protein UbiH [Zetaproteobacteria bacterium]
MAIMDHDIIIIGAGPAGLSFSRAMAETKLDILLIEKQPESVLADPPYDGREIALTHLSHKIMNDLGMWNLVPEEHISLIKTAKVMNGNSPYALSFDHTEVGEENLGFMISNHRIRKAAYESVKDYSNVTFLNEVTVSKVDTDDDKGWVELSDGRRLEAPLIIAADSRFSNTRRMMGISTNMLDFGRTCIVCTMEHELPHNDTAYECFHYDRTVAVLPLNNGQVSVVMTLTSEEDAGVLAMDEQEFSDDVARRIDYKFGQLKLSSKRYPYPLVSTLAKTFCANRFGLIGDAAVGMHPVTAHGFNLGLRGAQTLANEIQETLQSDGSFAPNIALERYSRKHRRHCLPLYHGTNALVRLYATTQYRTAKFARKALLRLGNHIKPAKRFIMNQLTETKDI